MDNLAAYGALGSVLAVRMLRALSLGYWIDPDRCLLIDKEQLGPGFA
jgi:hypothetical protein